MDAQASAAQTIGFGWLLFFQVALLPAVVVMTLGFVHFVDRKPLSELGVRWPPGGLAYLFRQALGAASGALALLAVWWILALPLLEFHIELLDGSAEERASSTQLALYALGFLLLAGLEEWIFRGYVYSALRERFPWIHAAGITALLFTLLHISNPNIQGGGLLNTCLLGLCLAAMRELTHSLWAPMVFHGTWNFTVGCITSLPLSGYQLPRLFVVDVKGPKVWSGGAYGPEGSWLLTIALLLLTVVLAQALHLRSEISTTDDDATPF